MKNAPPEDTGRVIALAVVFFGTLALGGWSAGVFSRLPDETLAALALFAVGFAAATYVLDDAVRAWVKGLTRRRARPTKAPAKSPARRPAAT